MRLPVLYNSNFQIQDLDGIIICDLFRNPKAEEDGERICNLLNASVPPSSGVIVPDVSNVPELPDVTKNGDVKKSQSERMKEYWRKKKMT